MADPQALYKEFKYLNSSSLNMEMQVGICRLELPLDMAVDSKEVPGELYLTSHILSNQMTMHEVSMRTYYGRPDTHSNAYVWDYVLNFPLKYRDLSRNSMIVFTVWRPDNTPFGGTSMYLFNDCGAMKRGKQKLVFYFDREADTHLQPETYGELYEKYSYYDEKFQNEKKMELYRNGYSVLDAHTPVVTCDWLDRLMLTQIQSTTGKSAATNASPEAYDLLTMATLVIEMPFLPHPVVFDEKCYPSVPPHMPTTAMEMLSASGIITETVDSNNNLIMEFNLTGKPFSGQALGLIVDWEMELDNPCEEMYHRLAQDSIRGRGTTDITLKPNLQEKEKLDRILKTPGDHIRTEDKDLMFRFRYALTENKMALAKFLLSLDWSSDSEKAELPTLLGMWKTKAPIEVADALKLLGRGVAFQSPIVRQYAVDVLRKASDDELRVLLLQLVQALRYEPGLHDLVMTQAVDSSDSSEETNSQRILRLSPLAAFLIERGCQSNMVANFLYWFLKVEIEDATMGTMFKSVFDAFMETLSSSSERGALVALQLKALDTYVMNIGRCQRMARDEKGKKDAKEMCMKRLLSDTEVNSIPNGLACVPLPLDPSLVITGLDPMSTFLFRSAMYPAVINFRVQPVDSTEELHHDHVVIEPQPIEEQSIVLVDQQTASPAPDGKQYKVIFKSGDDLRQDQLIMQFISLMDSLLKKVNLDLRLLTYGILATAPNDGIMEFVRDSMPVSAVTSQHGSILAFLRHYNGDANGPLGVKASAMDTYVRSCAGSCVVTYLLGIGDRHLDNVMMCKNGQMFHIDFGFIFGRDPKPLPPPFRFTRAMAEAMGGEDHEQYNRFKSYCCQAFNWLRKSANLILNLLSLMADAGIPDLSVHSDPVTVLGRVEEKFRLDLTDEQAEQYFLGLINETLAALAPRLMELAHQIAVARR